MKVDVRAPRELHSPSVHCSNKVSIQGAIKLVAWDCVVIKTNNNCQLRAPLVVFPLNSLRDMDVRLASERLKVLHIHAYAVVGIVWTEQLVVLLNRMNSSTVDLVGILLDTLPVWLHQIRRR